MISLDELKQVSTSIFDVDNQLYIETALYLAQSNILWWPVRHEKKIIAYYNGVLIEIFTNRPEGLSDSDMPHMAALQNNGGKTVIVHNIEDVKDCISKIIAKKTPSESLL